MKKKIIALMLAVVMCLGVLPLSASAAAVGETHTVTLDTTGVPGRYRRTYNGVTLTVTNGDKWDLPDPLSDSRGQLMEEMRGLYGWYMCSWDRVYNGTVIDLDSDIILYAQLVSNSNGISAYNEANPENKIRPICWDENHNHPRVKERTDPNAATVVTDPNKHTVTFNATEFPIPGDLIGSIPAPITVTNGDKWNLTKPIWFTATGTKIAWYTIDLEPINNGDVINLDSDITVYACPIEYADYTRAEREGNSNPDKIAATASSWAQADVAEASKAGIVPDNLKSKFTTAITREEFCVLMVKLIEAEAKTDIASYVSSKGKTVSAPFTDTSAQEVKAAYTLGIVNGTSATTFNPKGTITRQEAAAMLERTAKVLNISSNGTGMSFSDNAADWAKNSVAFVSGCTDPVSGSPIMGGVGNGRFDPYGTYTREQAIVTTLRLFHCA